MTSGNVGKRIFLFSLPLMVGNFLQQLYNTVDGIVVGRFVSQQALAAVGTCTSPSFLLVSIAIGLSTGSGIMISQYIGANRMADVRKAVSTSLILISALGLLLTVIGSSVARPILQYLLAVPDDGTLDGAATYFSIYCLGLVFQFVYNIVAAILRAVGNSRATLYFLLVASVLNIALDLLFVISFGWGVMGVAAATVISQVVCALVSIIYMFKKYPYMRFSRKEFRLDGEKAVLAMKFGVNATLQMGAVSFGHVLIQRLINGFGWEMIAGLTAAMRVENYIMTPIMSYNAAVSTFTGQNIGAGDYDRVKKGYKSTMILSCGTCLLIILFTMLFAGPLVRIFSVSGLAYDYAVSYLLFLSPCLILFSVYQVTTSTLQGAGDVFWCMIFSTVSLSLRVSLAFILANYTPISYRAIWYCYPVGWAAALTLSLIRLKSGKWKDKAVVKAQSGPLPDIPE